MSNPDSTSPSLPGPPPDVLSERWQQIREWKPVAVLQAAQQRMPWFWPYGGVALVIVIALWPAFTTSSRLIVGGDGLINYYPWFELWRDQIAAGELPLWNPYTFSGFPAFATPQAGYGYPVHWALTWLPPIVAFNWSFGLHILLAGIGTAWCAGRLGASKEGQFLAGVVFALGSVVTARLVAGHLAFVESTAWLPIATGLVVTIDERYRVQLLALVMGLLATAAQPELIIFAGWWLPLWAGAVALQNGRRRVFIAIMRTGLGFVLGLGIAAFLLLPIAEVQAISNRAGDLPWDFRTSISLPVWHLLGIVNPDVFGSSSDGSYWPNPGYYWHERLLYIGLIPLVVACLARGRAGWLCLGAAVLAVLLAFGRHFPLYGLIDFVPGYDLFRNPPKHLLLAGLGLSLAAGLGLTRVSMYGRGLAGAAAAGALLVLIASQTTGAWLPTFVELLGGAEGVSRAEVETHARDAEGPLVLASLFLAGLALFGLLTGPWAVRGVIALAVLELAVVLQPYWIERSDPGVYEQEAARYAGDRSVAVLGDGAFLGNYGPVVEVRQPSGYTSMFSGGYMELVVGYRNAGVIVNAQPGSEPILYLLGYEGVTERGSNVVTVFDPPPPTVWVSGCSWPGGAAQARMAGFPLFSCVTREGAVTRDDVVDPGRAEVLNEGTRSLTAKAEGPGWLVTPIPWYPGWSATIDGQAAAIEVLDGALVGVQLAEGEHTVEFTYWPAGLNLGIGITLASLAAAGALWYSERRGMKWTRFGLEASNGIVADEADNDRQQEDPEHDDRKSATAE